jgi:hypothetical protein
MRAAEIRVGVIGAGSWGTTVASLAAVNTPTTLWARRSDLVDTMRSTHENPDYLAGFELTDTLRVTDSIEEAVAEITGFYRNYHSSRYVHDSLVVRVRQAPSAAELAALNDEFADILEGGAIEARGALPEEGGEADSLPRVVLRFDRKQVGRLRQLIDGLNALAAPAASASDAAPHEIVAVPLPPEAESAEGSGA